MDVDEEVELAVDGEDEPTVPLGDELELELELEEEEAEEDEDEDE